MKLLIILGLVVLILGVGCVSSQSNIATNPDHAMINEASDAMGHDDAMNSPAEGDAMTDPNNTAMDDSTMHDDNTMMDDGSMMGGSVSYVPFTLAAYTQAKAEGKTIFLEFYANWCPICAGQAPKLLEGFSQLHSTKLIAFRVNYNDSDTDADEEALAKKFNIVYQHTHVVTDAGEKSLLKSQEDWSAQDVVEKLSPFA